MNGGGLESLVGVSCLSLQYVWWEGVEVWIVEYLSSLLFRGVLRIGSLIHLRQQCLSIYRLCKM